MKRLVTIIALFIITLPAFAQEEQTLFGNGRLEIGGFGGPMTQLTPIRKELGVLVGGYGALLLNHSFAIGAGGFGLVNNIKASPEAQDYYRYMQPMPYQSLYLEMGYGGGIIEYIHNPSALVHVAGRVLIGGGAVDYRYGTWSNYGDYHDYSRPNTGTDLFFVVEPSLNVELNIISWMRVQAGASYRYVSGVGTKLVGIQDSDIAGASGVLTFKFGKF